MQVLPDGAFLAVNLDGEALASDEVTTALAAGASERIVIELTEHVEIDDYPGLRRSLARLRDLGARLAIEDTGAGRSSFAHILQLSPELLKLDLGIVRGIDRHPVRRSLVTAVVASAKETGSRVCAEGIETADELAVLQGLGVHLGQGYGLGGPMPPCDLDAWLSRGQPAIGSA
jgi:EAL domain-containing protein (putative c-di-GMP-specific phosphodiesterase class I)